ncbi:hypothetical protein AKO1_011802 [Acrasis kona]|uniref:Apoptosis inhibitor 5 n=1 Tax=Acrasis kona TaxID=1008807 RepID=A0AAW2Z5I5_9EUKA
MSENKSITETESTQVDELYKHDSILSSAGEDKSKHEASYKAILDFAGANASDKCKTLACQLIPRYFKYFPKLYKAALTAQVDLCDEEAISKNVLINYYQISVNAIKGLPQFCKEGPDHAKQISNVLGQLLANVSKLEAATAKSALLEVFRDNFKIALTSTCSLITSDENVEEVKQAVFMFLKDQILPEIKRFIPQGAAEESETLLQTELAKLIKSKKKDESFLQVLKNMDMFKTENGRRNFINMVTQSSVLSHNQDFTPEADGDKLEAALSEINNIGDGFEKSNTNAPYFNFLIQKVIQPHFDVLDDKTRVQVLRAAAYLSPYTSASDARNALPITYQHLMLNIPMPQASSGDKKPEINFSYLECLLYTFHQLGQKVPGALNKVCGIKIVTGQPQDDMGDYSDKRSEMISKLRYLEEQSKVYRQRVEALKRAAKATAKKEESQPSSVTASSDDPTTAHAATKSEETKQEQVIDAKQVESTRRVVYNLEKLAENLSRANKPVFLRPDQITLSWKDRVFKKDNTNAPSAPSSSSSGNNNNKKNNKRPAPAGGEQNPSKKAKELYKPPNQRGGDHKHKNQGNKGNNDNKRGSGARRRGGKN